MTSFKSKKLLMILCSFLLVFVFMFAAACNGGDKDNGNYFGEIDDLVLDEYGDPVFNDVKLEVWSIIGKPDNVHLAKVEKMFNDTFKAQGIEANIQSITDADYYGQLVNAINTDPTKAPDVVIFHSERLPKLAADKVILPMQRYLDAGNADHKDEDYLASTIKQCYYNDTLYGIPLDVHAGVWYCRTDILEKNGLTQPTNQQEFIAVNNALIKQAKEGTLWTRAMDPTNAAAREWKQLPAKTDYRPLVMCEGSGVEAGMIAQTAVIQNGGKLVDDKGMPVWNTKPLVDTFAMLRDWQNGGGTATEGPFIGENESPDTVWSRLTAGTAVFSSEGPWWIEEKLDQYEAVLGADSHPLDIFNMSKMFTADPNSPTADKIYGIGHSICTTRIVKSKTKRIAAALFAQFMSLNAVDYTQGGHLPASKSILASKQYKEKPFYKRYLEKFGDPENFVMLGETPYYDEVFATLGEAYKDIFRTSKEGFTPQQIVDRRYAEALQYIESLEDL